MKRLTILLTLFLAFGMHAFTQSMWSGRAYLGIYSEQVSQEKAKVLGFDNPYGSYVTKVLKNTAAETAGIQPFDYIYGINDQETTFTKDLNDLLEDYRPGDKATVHYIRDGRKKTVEVTFGKSSSNAIIASEKAFLGVSPHAENSDSELGVKVYVVGNSTAEAMGIQDGDVILTINGHKMVDWTDLSIAIGNLKAGENIVVEFERNGKTMRAEMPIKSQSETQTTAVYAQESRTDQWAYLGIYSNEISAEKAAKLNFDNEYGSYVTQVLPGTTAAQAELQPFDYIYGVNDYRTNASENLTKILKRFKPGDKATIHLIRNGAPKSIEITFGNRAASETFIKVNECDSPLLGVRELDNTSKGVAVAIVKKSTAEEMGLQEGDIITKINGYPIIDWKDIRTAVNNLHVGEPVTVDFLRNGKVQTASKPIKSYCDTYPEDGRMNWNWEWKDDFEYKDESTINNEPIREVDAVNAIVDLKDLAQSEIAEIKNRFGIQMPSSNELKISELSITPNVQTGKYHLQFNLPQEGETSVNVYNAAGRQIYNYDLGTFQGDFSDQIDISQNGIGSYYLEIRQGDKALAKKILLQTR